MIVFVRQEPSRRKAEKTGVSGAEAKKAGVLKERLLLGQKRNPRAGDSCWVKISLRVRIS